MGMCNLSGYDAHFIIKEMTTAYEGQIDLFPITKEKYILITKNVKSTIDNQKNLYKITIYRFIQVSQHQSRQIVIFSQPG